MSKAVSTTLIAIFFIGGIVLGNLYGRRDVVNSRPPHVSGDLSQPQTTVAATSTSQTNVAATSAGSLSTLLLVNPKAKSSVYGSFGLSSSGQDQQLVLDITTKPKSLSAAELAGDFKLNLYKADNSLDKELETFKFDSGPETKVTTTFQGLTSGQYFGITVGTTTDPLLVSTKVQ